MAVIRDKVQPRRAASRLAENAQQGRAERAEPRAERHDGGAQSTGRGDARPGATRGVGEAGEPIGRVVFGGLPGGQPISEIGESVGSARVIDRVQAQLVETGANLGQRGENVGWGGQADVLVTRGDRRVGM